MEDHQYDGGSEGILNMGSYMLHHMVLQHYYHHFVKSG